MSLPRKSTETVPVATPTWSKVDVPVAGFGAQLTDPGLIRIWSGQKRKIDPRKGGRICWAIAYAADARRTSISST